jgi:hypothetical protein
MRRGQATIELLSTYGWMLFIVLAIIAALIYFDVLDTDRFLEQQCVLRSGLACLDFRGEADSIEITVENQLGFDILNITADISGVGCSTNATGPGSLLNGEQGTYAFSCSPATGKYQGSITIGYSSKPTSERHEKTGSIIVSIP